MLYYPLREVSLVYTRKFEKSQIIGNLADVIQDDIPVDLSESGRCSLMERRASV